MNVSRETNEKLTQFVELIRKWNSTINLISKESIKSLWERHVEDSLQLLRYLDKDSQIIDLGSGAGFPGIVLSIAGVKHVRLLESDSRKCAFLLQASRLSSNHIEIINERVELINELECDVLTSRAFANLSKTFQMSANIKVKDKYLLLKGKTIGNEVMTSEKEWLFKYKLHDSITQKEGRIIEIFDLERKI